MKEIPAPPSTTPKTSQNSRRLPSTPLATEDMVAKTTASKCMWLRPCRLARAATCPRLLPIPQLNRTSPDGACPRRGACPKNSSKMTKTKPTTCASTSGSNRSRRTALHLPLTLARRRVATLRRKASLQISGQLLPARNNTTASTE